MIRSPSETSNNRFCTLALIMPLPVVGFAKTVSTCSMETIVNISSEHPNLPLKYLLVFSAEINLIIF